MLKDSEGNDLYMGNSQNDPNNCVIHVNPHNSSYLCEVSIEELKLALRKITTK